MPSIGKLQYLLSQYDRDNHDRMKPQEEPMFRFTIRELVLLTLVVAMGVAWWIDRRQLKRGIVLREAAFTTLASFVMFNGDKVRVLGDYELLEISNDEGHEWNLSIR